MPRGIYERKPKGDKTVAAKKTAVVAKKATAVKSATKTETRAAVSQDAILDLGPSTGKIAESIFGFQILGANITTLSSAYDSVKEDKNLSKLIGEEITATVETLKALRMDTFAGLYSLGESHKTPLKSVDYGNGKEAVAETKTENKVPAPVTALPTPVAVPVPPAMPQGNSSFTPPAPPALPQH